MTVSLMGACFKPDPRSKGEMNMKFETVGTADLPDVIRNLPLNFLGAHTKITAGNELVGYTVMYEKDGVPHLSNMCRNHLYDRFLLDGTYSGEKPPEEYSEDPLGEARLPVSEFVPCKIDYEELCEKCLKEIRAAAFVIESDDERVAPSIHDAFNHCKDNGLFCGYCEEIV